MNIPEAELEKIKGFYEQIPFNRLLGIHLSHISEDKVAFKCHYQKDFVGNYVLGILHGGVIATVLDVAGGAMAFLGIYQKIRTEPEAEQAKRLSKIGTIDLRVDYLRPGRGLWFEAEASLIRTGNKVSVARMSMQNDQAELIAVGTATYICG